LARQDQTPVAIADIAKSENISVKFWKVYYCFCAIQVFKQ
jgi:hypothetical protein